MTMMELSSQRKKKRILCLLSLRYSLRPLWGSCLLKRRERATDHPAKHDQHSESPSEAPGLQKPASDPCGGRPCPLVVRKERHPAPAS